MMRAFRAVVAGPLSPGDRPALRSSSGAVRALVEDFVTKLDLIVNGRAHAVARAISTWTPNFDPVHRIESVVDLGSGRQDGASYRGAPRRVRPGRALVGDVVIVVNERAAYRAGRRQFSHFVAARKAQLGGRVLILAPDAASAWASWTAFIKDHIEHQNDDLARVTTFPGGGSVRVSEAPHEAPRAEPQAKLLEAIYDECFGD